MLYFVFENILGVSQAVVESLKTTAQIHLEKPVKLLETFSINAHGNIDKIIEKMLVFV